MNNFGKSRAVSFSDLKLKLFLILFENQDSKTRI